MPDCSFQALEDVPVEVGDFGQRLPLLVSLMRHWHGLR